MTCHVAPDSRVTAPAEDVVIFRFSRTQHRRVLLGQGVRPRGRGPARILPCLEGACAHGGAHIRAPSGRDPGALAAGAVNCPGLAGISSCCRGEELIDKCRPAARVMAQCRDSWQ